MGLNHMNGRVQDAVTGTFLSADLVISDPDDPQNYNLYSYVLNNPMSFTDPSGYCPGGKFVNNLRLPDFVTLELNIGRFTVSATYTKYGDVFYGRGGGESRGGGYLGAGGVSHNANGTAISGGLGMGIGIGASKNIYQENLFQTFGK